MTGRGGRVVGVFGTFDVELIGELALVRVLERELGSRLPGITLDWYAPFGSQRPMGVDGGRTAKTLPGLRGVAAPSLSTLLVVGDVLAGAEWFVGLYGEQQGQEAAGLFSDAITADDSSCPILWSCVGAPADLDPQTAVASSGRLLRGHFTVRDQVTATRLIAAGAGQPPTVAGDPLLLLSRAFDPDALARRRRLLRVIGCLSTDGSPIAVEAGVLGARSDGRASLPSTATVFDTDLRDRAVQPATQVLQSGLRWLPAASGPDDVAALLSAASAAIVVSPAGLGLALGMQVPAVLVASDPRAEDTARKAGCEVITETDGVAAAIDRARRTQPPPGLRELRSSVEAEFDRLAEVIQSATGREPKDDATIRVTVARPVPAATADAAATRAAEVLLSRLVHERSAFQAELSRLQGKLDHVLAAPSYRVLEPLRVLYRALRRRRSSP